jgi:serpin B
MIPVVLAAGLGINRYQNSESRLPVDKNVVTAETRFGFKLFNELAQQTPKSNIVISPASLFQLLSITYNGADGGTKTAMEKALELQGISLDQLNRANNAALVNMENPGRKVKTDVANFVWVRKGIPFEKAFLETSRDFYKAEVNELDFSAPNAASVINDCVRKKTRGNIDGVVETFKPNDILVLLNTVYFRGKWSHSFDPSKTKQSEFTLADGSKKLVPMMQEKMKVRSYSGDNFQAVNLPYGKCRLSMYVFLPNKDSSLQDFLNNLNQNNWDKWVSSFSEPREIPVELPRFAMKYDSHDDIKRALSTMGMGVLFDREHADLRKASPLARDKSNNVYVDEIAQQAVIEVNEKGTKAYAVSFELFAALGIERGFIADRPFFFAIRDNKTGVILFMGTVWDPK